MLTSASSESEEREGGQIPPNIRPGGDYPSAATTGAAGGAAAGVVSAAPVPASATGMGGSSAFAARAVSPVPPRTGTGRRVDSATPPGSDAWFIGDLP